MNMRISKLKLAILIGMSLFGLAAASEVLITYYVLQMSLPGCTPGGLFDCARVLSSTYSEIYGVPLELFAVAYFIVNLGLVYVISFGSDAIFRRALNILFIWRFLGLMLVPYLVVVEVFFIHAICIYCTMMHVAIVSDFIIISYLLFFGKQALWRKEEERELAAEAALDQPSPR